MLLRWISFSPVGERWPAVSFLCGGVVRGGDEESGSHLDAEVKLHDLQMVFAEAAERVKHTHTHTQI